jgi:hypothetical protein
MKFPNLNIFKKIMNWNFFGYTAPSALLKKQSANEQKRCWDSIQIIKLNLNLEFT